LSMPFRLIVPRQVNVEMVEQAVAEQPNECCGLLGGVVEICSDGSRVGHVVKRYPLVNEAKSPVEFYNAANDLFAAMRDMRELRLDTLVVYHSHPAGEPKPSKKDLARHYYWGPEVMSLIISLATTPPMVRAWWLTDADYREAEWTVLPGEDKTAIGQRR
jgi:[CysO sulfur-carrier protein]-S-L-cysteine hydrolase